MLKQVFAVLIAAMAIFIMSCDESPTGSDNPLDTLAAPTISVTAGDAEVSVDWDSIPGASSYTVYWAQTAGVTAQSSSIPNITASMYNITGLSNGVTYYYRVSAAGEGFISSPLSNEESGTPQGDTNTVETPTNVDAEPGDGTVTLSWESKAPKFKVYWATTAGVTTSSTMIDNITKAGYLHDSLTNGTTYYYRVSALDTAGNESDLSAEVNATPGEITLEPPENFTAAPGDGKVTLTWEKSTGAERYTIYLDTVTGVSDQSTAIDSITELSYTHAGLTNGKMYFYKISAQNADTTSALSAEVSAIPDTNITLDPPNVTATKGNSMVTLAWKTVAGAVKYNIYWATSAGVTTQSDSIPGIEKEVYTHTGLTNNTTYYYRVNAMDANGNKSALSDEVNATPDTVVSDLVPKNVVATAGAGQVTISWDEVTGADAMVIYCATEPNFTKPEETIKTPTNPHTHSGLTPGTTYYYRVVAWDGKDTYESVEVSATPTK